MTDEIDGSDDDSHCEPPQARWIRRTINNIKEQFHQSRANKQKETPQDKFSRRLAHATVAIAILTAAIVLVGTLQCFTSEWQLSAMRGQLDEKAYAVASGEINIW